MASRTLLPNGLTLGLTLLAGAATCSAQPTQTISITGHHAANSPGVAGFGDVPLARAPFSATVISTSQMLDAGITSLADITRLDASLTDAYNAPGYWGQLAVRGFTLDNRFNFRRDGLPINAETVLHTGNKAALELFKGTSGIQAGTSAPGGLLNLVVKRPTAQQRRQVAVDWMQPGTWSVAADLGDRTSPGGAVGSVGWRLNLDASQLNPMTRGSRGNSHLLAAAAELQTSVNSKLEVELEASHQSQPSTPGFSLLGPRLPDARAIDARLNLNNQPWTLPVVMDGVTGSVRYSMTLASNIELVAHAMQQRLRNQDRIAFPYGCDSEGVYTRYCSDGSFDFYDFRSEGERRTTRAAQLTLQGKAQLAGMQHQWSLGVLASRHQARFNRQAFNWVGSGSIDGRSVVPADPALTGDNTQRDERSTEWQLRDVLSMNERWQLWLGARLTRLERDSVRTDGSEPTTYAQTLATPWLAITWRADAHTTAYLSTGQGVESEVVPNRPRYSNAGVALPALRSRQVEAGIKQRRSAMQWAVAVFEVQRPTWSDILNRTGKPSDACDDSDPCTRRGDGVSRHRGLELEAETTLGALALRGSVAWLQARREGSADVALNGLKPTNVPDRSLKLQAAWNVASVPGLALLAYLSHEGPRAVVPDNHRFTDGWTRLDLAMRYAMERGSQRWVWRLGVDNATDARHWKESPYQFGHAYLYPLAPRTWRASLNIGL